MRRSRSRSHTRSRSRSPHRSYRHKRDTHTHAHSPKRRHKSHTHSKEHRKKHTRSRSRSPKLEEIERTIKKISLDKKRSLSSYKKDYSDYKLELKRAYKREKKRDYDNNSSDLDNSEETEMMRVMGFAEFHSTKGEKKTDQYLGKMESEVRIVKKRRYRQYMNRRGGFNRPLDPIN
ncbi:U4/U6.U5 small nuclear ribonucleoprotein 27 kDa protein-like [Oopsacas minuta]|uniref:U4/U6.U5 small nuclear ribonucleoprotein 27 kDa protein n=1 Tax=Oopsacas minuta TaxID=111878 RepID=A0AAV7JNF1_9METZ|nr:U4/U6.U5 small nuclear ribonucleoprotein 27 kDa protein-like [Oopsacas minuta]